MTWSYSGNPAESDLDQLRFLIGDTNEDDQQLSNEELDFLLSSREMIPAAIAACRALIARYSTFVDQKTGDIDIKYSQRLAGYNNLLSQLRSSDEMLPAPYAGGISKSDIDAVNEDTDRQRPEFGLGMQDYPVDESTGSGGTGGVI